MCQSFNAQGPWIHYTPAPGQTCGIKDQATCRNAGSPRFRRCNSLAQCPHLRRYPTKTCPRIELLRQMGSKTVTDAFRSCCCPSIVHVLAREIVKTSSIISRESHRGRGRLSLANVNQYPSAVRCTRGSVTEREQIMCAPRGSLEVVA